MKKTNNIFLGLLLLFILLFACACVEADETIGRTSTSGSGLHPDPNYAYGSRYLWTGNDMEATEMSFYHKSGSGDTVYFAIYEATSDLKVGTQLWRSNVITGTDSYGWFTQEISPPINITDNTYGYWFFMTSNGDFYVKYGSTIRADCYLSIHNKFPLDTENWVNSLYDDRDVATYLTLIEPNIPPILSSENPPNATLDLPCDLLNINVTIIDLNNDTMNWTIETKPNVGNAFGNNAANGSLISCPLFELQADVNYTWYVNVTDGSCWTNGTYWFITDPPEWFYTNEGPMNGSTGISRSPSVNLTVNMLNCTTSNISFYTNITGSWIKESTVHGGNGSYAFNYTNASDYSTTYWWKIYTNEAGVDDSVIYSFTTEAAPPPTMLETVQALAMAIIQASLVLGLLGLIVLSFNRWKF